jgi:peptidoglycan/LPS O-acetylase OafA/YrhL
LLSSVNIGKEKYPALTGIRALGAAAVFFDHFYAQKAEIVINVMAFFFVLSGFLIIRIYYSSFEFSGRWLSKYFINRFARIYPVYFLLLTVAVLLHHEYLGTGIIIRNYTFTQALLNIKDVVIQPCWSLTVEECFYFIAPLIIIICKRSNFFMALLLSAGMLCGGLLVSEFKISFLQSKQFIFSTTYLGHFFEFYTGVFLALVMMKQEKQGPKRSAGIKWTILGAAGVLLLLMVMMFIYTVKPLNTTLIILINNFFIPVPIAILYFGFITEQSFFSRFLSTKLMGLLGRSSYAFYVLHMIIISYISRPLLSHYVNDTTNLLITFIITTIGSIAIFLFYEEPLNIFIRSKFKSKAATAEIPVWIPASAK